MRYIGGEAPTGRQPDDSNQARLIRYANALNRNDLRVHIVNLARSLDDLYNRFSRDPRSLDIMRDILNITEILYASMTRLDVNHVGLVPLQRDYQEMQNMYEAELRRQEEARAPRMEGQGFGKIYTIDKPPVVYRR